MKRLVSGILIFLLALQAFYPATVYTYYYANKAYIASALCENKARPQMQCKGKCFLKKQLQKAQQQEDTQKDVAQKMQIVIYLPVAAAMYTGPVAEPVAERHKTTGNKSYHFQYLSALLRPPQA